MTAVTSCLSSLVPVDSCVTQPYKLEPSVQACSSWLAASLWETAISALPPALLQP